VWDLCVGFSPRVTGVPPPPPPATRTNYKYAVLASPAPPARPQPLPASHGRVGCAGGLDRVRPGARALDVFGFHAMQQPIKVGDLAFAHGYEFDTIVVTPTMYLAWLRDTVATSGVRIIQRHVGALAELAGYDVVVRDSEAPHGPRLCCACPCPAPYPLPRPPTPPLLKAAHQPFHPPPPALYALPGTHTHTPHTPRPWPPVSQINCTGLASKALVPDDTMMPARGVLLHVRLSQPSVWGGQVVGCGLAGRLTPQGGRPGWVVLSAPPPPLPATSVPCRGHPFLPRWSWMVHLSHGTTTT
jgi:hypothetical protein